MSDNRKWYEPGQIQQEYEAGKSYKSGLGKLGLYEQSRRNERFFVGEQWHGAECGDKPLLQHNVIKRVGDYKMAVVGAASVSVSYSADGVPCTVQSREKIAQERESLSQGGEMNASLTDSEKTTLIMGAMSDYFRISAERMKFEDKKTSVLRNAYISGTGVLYTYWDSSVRTGLYATADRSKTIVGDIQCEVLDVENVYFGDPNLDDVQNQPYIILAQRRSVDDVRREMKRMRATAKHTGEVKTDDPDSVIADEQERSYQAGDRSQKELEGAQKTTVLTKLYKEYDKQGECRVMAVKVCANGDVTVRHKWDTKLRMYPVAKMSWETRHNCIYGDSEVTHLIANQIAINRANTASSWAAMSNGVPIMLVDETVEQVVTNEPGQIIRANLTDGQNPIRFVTPPTFSPQFSQLIDSLIGNTLAQSGANDAALGDVRPDNTSAIVAAREAATMPLQIIQNRFYSFIEDVARIWAEFWVQMYGVRSLHIRDKSGDWYMPFNGEDYQNLLINTKIDVGAAGVWSEVQSIQTLDGLFAAKIIDAMQYLERLPKGVVPDMQGLLRDLRERAGAAQNTPTAPTQPSTDADVPVDAANGGVSVEQMLAMLPPEYREQWAMLSPQEQQQALKMAFGQ